jgi:hypothetical protein
MKGEIRGLQRKVHPPAAQTNPPVTRPIEQLTAEHPADVAEYFGRA